MIEPPLICSMFISPLIFAMGAVSLLHKLGVIDYLSFGSECQDINKLKQIASFLIQYEEAIDRGTKELMSLGHSYPKAKELYLRGHLDDTSLIEVLKQPNNILGIEYLKALLRLDSPIVPVCVTRVSNDHHSKELTPSISSATSIRGILEQNQIRPLFSRVPEALHDIYQMHYQKDFLSAWMIFLCFTCSYLFLRRSYTDQRYFKRF